MAFRCLVLLSIFLIHATNALQCTICQDRQSCNNQPPAQECNADLVDNHHRGLSHINPSLETAAPSSTFKCYDLDLYYRSALTGSLVLVVQKGCTYSTTNFCDGWSDNVDMTNCATCDSKDACNSAPAQKTTTSAPTSTTTVAPTSTTTVSAVSTTTTTADPASTTTTAVSSTTEGPNPTTTTTANPASTTTTTAASTSTSTISVSSTTSTPAPTSTTTTASATTTTTNTPAAGTTTTTTIMSPTSKPGSAECATMSWMLVVGFVLLHGLVAA
nr:integumentary mucin C.1-like isoform X2 [Aedes albopictus]